MANPVQGRSTNLNRAFLSGTVAAGAGTTTVVSGPGTLRSITVTTAGTATADTVIFDGTTGLGNLLGVVPGTCPVGTVIIFNQSNIQGELGVDYVLGLTFVQVASGPAFTVAYM